MLSQFAVWELAFAFMSLWFLYKQNKNLKAQIYQLVIFYTLQLTNALIFGTSQSSEDCFLLLKTRPKAFLFYFFPCSLKQFTLENIVMGTNS